MGDLAGESHLVGGHHDGASRLGKFADEVENLADEFWIQRAGDLVEQQ